MCKLNRLIPLVHFIYPISAKDLISIQVTNAIKPEDPKAQTEQTAMDNPKEAMESDTEPVVPCFWAWILNLLMIMVSGWFHVLAPLNFVVNSFK